MPQQRQLLRLQHSQEEEATAHAVGTTHENTSHACISRVRWDVLDVCGGLAPNLQSGCPKLLRPCSNFSKWLQNCVKIPKTPAHGLGAWGTWRSLWRRFGKVLKRVWMSGGSGRFGCSRQVRRAAISIPLPPPALAPAQVSQEWSAKDALPAPLEPGSPIFGVPYDD